MRGGARANRPQKRHKSVVRRACGANPAGFRALLVARAGCECSHMHLPARVAGAARARRRRCTRVVFVTPTADVTVTASRHRGALARAPQLVRALASCPRARWHVAAPTEERVAIRCRAHERRPFSGLESRCAAALVQTDLRSGTKAWCGARRANPAGFRALLVARAGCECSHMHLPARVAGAARARQRRCTRVVFVTPQHTLDTARRGGGALACTRRLLTPPAGHAYAHAHGGTSTKEPVPI